MPAKDLSTIAAELAVMADGTERYFERVRELGSSHLGEDRDDLLAAIHEAERALRAAHRALLRATRLAG
ncbi:MAG: hypothetical protein ACO3LC_01065 [Ilumatobacteraceae bacterium]